MASPAEVEIIRQQDEVRRSIEKLQNQMKLLEAKRVEARMDSFRSRWNADARDVLNDYRKLVDLCSYQGGQGYRLWIETPKSSAHHWVVHPEKYSLCKPTLRDHEAYYAVYGKDMSVTTDMHVEIWGN